MRRCQEVSRTGAQCEYLRGHTGSHSAPTVPAKIIPGVFYWDGSQEMWEAFVKQHGGTPERISLHSPMRWKR